MSADSLGEQVDTHPSVVTAARPASLFLPPLRRGAGLCSAPLAFQELAALRLCIPGYMLWGNACSNDALGSQVCKDRTEQVEKYVTESRVRQKVISWGWLGRTVGRHLPEALDRHWLWHANESPIGSNTACSRDGCAAVKLQHDRAT